jgi:aryl-alcohol dehydrogenase-like predicted oxidoreductase
VHAIHPISNLQVEYSLISRGIEKDILPTLRELGIGLTAYGVLSRGLISGHWSKAREGDSDFRSINPRFQGVAHSTSARRVHTPALTRPGPRSDVWPYTVTLAPFGQIFTNLPDA